MRRPTNLLQLKEGRKEGEREREPEGEREGRKRKGRERERPKEGERAREKEQRRRKSEKTLESIRPETDLRNPSQPTDTQNWDSVLVSSVRCTLKRREFAKGTPRINFTLSFTSALDNS